MRERYAARHVGFPFPMRVALEVVPPATLLNGPPGEESAPIRSRVTAARKIQMDRQLCLNSATLGHTPTMQVAQTIADLAGVERPEEVHFAEARFFTGDYGQ